MSYITIFLAFQQTLFQKLKDLKVQLAEDKKLYAEEEARIQGLKEEELKVSKEYDDRLDEVLREYSMLEEEQHLLEKETAEYRKGIRVRVDMKKSEGLAIMEEFGIIKNETRGNF